MTIKRKRLKKKRIIVLVLVVLTILFVGRFNSTSAKLSRLEYSKTAIKAIKKNNIDDEVLENKYSKTLEIAVTTKDFKKENLDIYLNTKYNNNKDITKQINTLVSIGYDKKEIKNIYEKLENEEINFITNYTYIDNLKSYLDYKIFKPENLERYVNYKNKEENSNLSYKDIILKVNMGLDKEFYDNPKTVEKPDELLVLVNKYNKLPDNYEAKDLEKIDGKFTVSEMYLNKTAKNAFESMCSDAKSINLIIKAVSTYRTKEYQQKLYNDYVNTRGLKYAEDYSARPRHSEHETGLAVDVRGGLSAYTLFENTEEYKWVKQNAHTYGFIIRYQEDKEDITGYNYESWHLRYVGIDVATYIYEHNITFDEYYAMFLDN